MQKKPPGLSRRVSLSITLAGWLAICDCVQAGRGQSMFCPTSDGVTQLSDFLRGGMIWAA
jgi:hypothetical protein